MMTFVRWIAGLVFLLSAALYALILALPVFFNPNDYKAQLIDLMEEKTGRKLEIAGDIQLQISPWLHANCTLGKTRLAGNALFTNSTCIASEQTKIELSLWPLLFQRRLHMPAIMLDGVTLNLLYNKEGLNNWQKEITPPADRNTSGADIADDTAKDASAGDNRQSAPLTRLLRQVTGIDLGRLYLNQVNARYDNRKTDTIILLKDLQLNTGRLRDDIPFPFEADFNLTLDNHGRQTSLPRSSDISMQGNATLFWQARRLLLEDFRLAATLKGKSLPKRGLKVGATTTSDINLRQEKITIKDFSLTHEDAILQGSGTIDNFTSPQFSLVLKIPECSPQALFNQLKTPLSPGQKEDAFTPLKASLSVQGNREQIEISKLDMLIDETTITGALTIREADSKPRYEAVLHLNQLDLSRYSGQKAGKEKEAQPPQTTADPSIIPVHFLRDLLLQLDLQLDFLKVGGAALSQVHINLNSEKGITRLAPLTATLYDGSMKLETLIDVSGDLPRIELKPRLNKVKLAPLFQDMTGAEEISGTAILQADINTGGLKLNDLINQMKGTLRLEILNGNLKALPIRQQIREALAVHQKEPLPEAILNDETTGFTRLTGTR